MLNWVLRFFPEVIEKMSNKFINLFFCIIFSSCLFGQEISRDSIHKLNTVVITGKKTDFLSLQNNSTKLDMRMMDIMPNILGNANPIHYLQFLSGIQVNNEYDAGLYVQGCDNGHNMVSIDGVPIYNSGHLLGIFSTFNATHYQSLLLNTHPNSSISPNRVGANVVMKLFDNIPNNINGQFSVGPISSQGTIKIPLSNQSSLFVSGRMSYLNLLYSQWLDIDGSKIKYDFGDFNITYLHKIDKKNTLWIDGYYGLDNVNIDDNNFGVDMSLEWGNKMLAAHLKTDISDLIHIRQKLFFTNYENLLSLKSDYVDIGIPSEIATYGYSADITYKQMMMGIDASYHSIEQQSPSVSNYYKDSSIELRQHSQELSAYLEYDFPLKNLLIKLGVRGSIFHSSDSKAFLSADPLLSILYEHKNNWSVKLTGYQRHQYLSQTGASSIGLPIEFWLASTESIPPQMTRGMSLTWRKFFGNTFSLSVEGFYKKLYHQIEYVGNLLDLKEKNYYIEKYIYPSKGENYGLSIILSERTGKIVGWMNYTYTNARRSSDNSILGTDYSPSHERPHELDMVITYKINKRWDLGSTFVYASGTAFTAPSSFYSMNGNIVSQYSGYNKNRLPGYLRLDISSNYYFIKKGNATSGINFSLYNALNTGNALLYRLKLYDNEYGYSNQMVRTVKYFNNLAK